MALRGSEQFRRSRGASPVEIARPGFADETVIRARRDPRGAAFPDEFLFGVASSDHQSEAFDPRYPDIWDRWEAQQGLAPRGRAADFWNRYPEDIELARALGCQSYRFSLSWARLEPRPGEFNAEAFEHYRDVIRRIREAGMQPVVTLMHWVWPLHVEDRGGLIAEEFPQWFRRFTAEVAHRLGQGVPYWVTFNEPNALPFGFIKPWWQPSYSMPPGLGDASPSRQAEAAARLVRNLFVAHTLARTELRAVHPETQVGANPCVLGLPLWFQRWLDHRITSAGSFTEWAREEAACASRRRVPLVPGMLERLGSLSFFADTNWWHLGMAGRLPEFLCPAECVAQHDYVGLDYYWGINTLRLPRLFQLMDAMQQQFGRAPVWPRGLYNALRYVDRLFPGMDVMIMENGSPTHVDGVSRPEYVRQHLREVIRARNHGVSVTAYHCWCLTSTCEWGLGAGQNCDFGLYHVDLEGDPELERIPTVAAQAYREIIAARQP